MLKQQEQQKEIIDSIIYAKRIQQSLMPTEKYIERNVNKLKDKRLIIINDYAENIEDIIRKLKIKKVDYIISGIPFSRIEKNKRNIIIDESKKCLSTNGKFIAYQFRNDIDKSLKINFNFIKSNIELINIPPLRIIEAYN